MCRSGNLPIRQSQQAGKCTPLEAARVPAGYTGHSARSHAIFHPQFFSLAKLYSAY